MRNLDKDFTREEANEQYTDPFRNEGGGHSKPTERSQVSKNYKRFVCIGALVILSIFALIYFLININFQ